jgi:dihydrofolate reductase
MIKPSVSIVVAVSENNAIGKDGDLPWKIPSDLNRFRRITWGKPVIMGKNTFYSLPTMLRGRKNIVLTTAFMSGLNGVVFSRSLPEALRIAANQTSDEVMIIGGEAVFKAASSLATRIYLTRVHANVEGDSFFPIGDFGGRWQVIYSEIHWCDSTDEFPTTYCVLEKRD